MKNKLSAILIALSSVVFSLTSHSADDSEQHQFVGDLRLSMELCAMHAVVGDYLGSQDDTYECVSDNKGFMKEKYKKVKVIISGNNVATDELKNLYSYWLTTMDNIIPNTWENEYQYEARITQRKLGLDDRANRYLIGI